MRKDLDKNNVVKSVVIKRSLEQKIISLAKKDRRSFSSFSNKILEENVCRYEER